MVEHVPDPSRGMQQEGCWLGLDQLPKDVDFADIANQGEQPPLYIYFGFGANRESTQKIGIGRDLTRVALDPKHPRRLASEEEVLALHPELRQTE